MNLGQLRGALGVDEVDAFEIEHERARLEVVVRELADAILERLGAYVGVYDNVADAKADYKVVHDLHTGAGLIDAYDVAVIERREGGKAKAVKKHETPTRVAGSSATG